MPISNLHESQDDRADITWSFLAVANKDGTEGGGNKSENNNQHELFKLKLSISSSFP